MSSNCNCNCNCNCKGSKWQLLYNYIPQFFKKKGGFVTKIANANTYFKSEDSFEIDQLVQKLYNFFLEFLHVFN